MTRCLGHSGQEVTEVLGLQDSLGVGQELILLGLVELVDLEQGVEELGLLVELPVRLELVECLGEVGAFMLQVVLRQHQVELVVMEQGVELCCLRQRRVGLEVMDMVGFNIS